MLKDWQFSTIDAKRRQLFILLANFAGASPCERHAHARYKRLAIEAMSRRLLARVRCTSARIGEARAWSACKIDVFVAGLFCFRFFYGWTSSPAARLYLPLLISHYFVIFFSFSRCSLVILLNGCLKARRRVIAGRCVARSGPL